MKFQKYINWKAKTMDRELIQDKEINLVILIEDEPQEDVIWHRVCNGRGFSEQELKAMFDIDHFWHPLSLEHKQLGKDCVNQLLNEAEFSYLKELLLDDKEEAYGTPAQTNKDETCTRNVLINALKLIRMHKLPSNEFLKHTSDRFPCQLKKVQDFITNIKEKKLPFSLNLVYSMN